MLIEATEAAPAVNGNFGDGTFDGAAQAIANIRSREEPAGAQEEPAPAPRGADGKFSKADSEQSGEKAKEDDAPGDEEDDYLEIEEEGEGEEPKRTRHSVSEVWNGFKEAQKLKAELESYKAEKPAPAEWESATEAAITERARYVDALTQWAQFNPVRPPNEDLINPNNPNYNPEAYWQQSQAFKQAQADHESIRKEVERVSKINEAQSVEMLKARALRERSKVFEVWPELKEKASAEKAIAALKKDYGFDDNTLSTVIDSRFYALAKDALAFRSQQTAKQEAVRKVIAKPKLVRAGARTNTDSKAAARNDASTRLARSGSIDDAAAVLATLR